MVWQLNGVMEDELCAMMLLEERKNQLTIAYFRSIMINTNYKMTIKVMFIRLIL